MSAGNPMDRSASAFAALLLAVSAFASLPACSSAPDDESRAVDDGGAHLAGDADLGSAAVAHDAGSAGDDASVTTGGADGAAGSAASDGGTATHSSDGGTGSADGGTASAIGSMLVISRGVPAVASSGTASDANDADYSTTWRSSETPSASTPSWIAYDLSAVPASSRHEVDVAWYAQESDYAEYDLAAKPGAVAYNEPRDYTIDANAAAGGAAPTSGWVSLTTVTGNTYTSRQVAVDLTGYNWIRLHVTGVNGTSENTNVALNVDVHDAPDGLTDSWLFLGDSITAFALRNDGADIGARSFAELVNAANPTFFPAEEGAGEGGWSSGTPLANGSGAGGSGTIFDTWVKTFPGRYICLSYGTNDGADTANMGATPTYDNLVTMVTKVIAAGKVPCIPHVPWATDAAHQKNAQLINTAIDALYAKYPAVVKGPDLYSVLEGHTELYQDNLHPNSQGRETYRQAWASTLTASVYR
jgi:lysophospholipase L1-like esterase